MIKCSTSIKVICLEYSSFINKSHKNSWYFQYRPMYIYDNISLNSSQNEKCFRKKLERKSKHTFYVQ